jgi:hypothetical protein
VLVAYISSAVINTTSKAAIMVCKIILEYIFSVICCMMQSGRSHLLPLSIASGPGKTYVRGAARYVTPTRVTACCAVYEHHCVCRAGQNTVLGKFLRKLRARHAGISFLPACMQVENQRSRPTRYRFNHYDIYMYIE